MRVWNYTKTLLRTQTQPLYRVSIFESAKAEFRSTGRSWNSRDLVLLACFIQIDLMYLCDVRYLVKDEGHPTFIHSTIMYAVCGTSLLYMEMFLGQYVQHGCLFLRNISPVTCATIGYGMLLILFLTSVSTSGELADIYMFLFRSVGSELPWMKCTNITLRKDGICFGHAELFYCNQYKNCSETYPIIKPNMFSAQVHYDRMIRRSHYVPRMVQSTFEIRGFLLVLAWLTVYMSTKNTLGASCQMAKRILIIVCFFVVFLMLPLLGYMTTGLSYAPFLKVTTGSLISWQAWLLSLNVFFARHSVCRGGYQMIGRHLKPTSSVLNMSLCICAITFLFDVFCQMFSSAVLGIMLIYLKFGNIQNDLNFPPHSRLFNFFPFALGMLPIPQIWSVTFYTIVALWALLNTVINIAVLEASIYDGFPTMVRYRKYVRPILCMLGCLTGLVMMSNANIKVKIILKITERLTCIIVLILTVTVGYIYGVERFSDDINFLYGSQPTRYWKICWKLLPLGMLILISDELYSDVSFVRDDKAKVTSDAIYLILIILAFLHLLRLIVISMKEKNLAGMFQAVEAWGPPIDQDRDKRRMYNPREETKYWRKDSNCTHHCLIDKTVFTNILEEELKDRAEKAQSEKRTTREENAIALIFKTRSINYIERATSKQLDTFEREVERKTLLAAKEQSHRNEKQKDKVAPSKLSDEIDDETRAQLEKDRILEEKKRLELLYDEYLSTPEKRSSRTKRLPIFAPKETPRNKKNIPPIKKTIVGSKSTTNYQTAYVNIKSYTIQFSKESSNIHEMSHTPASTIAAKKLQSIISNTCYKTATTRPSKDYLKKPNSTLPKNSLSHKTPEGRIPSSRITSRSSESKVPVPPPFLPNFRDTKSSSEIPSRYIPPFRERPTPPLPMWHLPPNTPRPKVCGKPASRSSSSASNISVSVSKFHKLPLMEASPKLPVYFMNVRLPPKANLEWPIFSSFATGLPATIPSIESEMSLLRDPVLQDILTYPCANSSSTTGLPDDYSPGDSNTLASRESLRRVVNPRMEPMVPEFRNYPDREQRFAESSRAGATIRHVDRNYAPERANNNRVVRFASTKHQRVDSAGRKYLGKHVSYPTETRPSMLTTEPTIQANDSEEINFTPKRTSVTATWSPRLASADLEKTMTILKPHPRTSITSILSTDTLTQIPIPEPTPLPRRKLSVASRHMPSSRPHPTTEQMLIRTASNSKLPDRVDHGWRHTTRIPVTKKITHSVKMKHKPFKSSARECKTDAERPSLAKRKTDDTERQDIDKMIEIRINKILQGVRDEKVGEQPSRFAKLNGPSNSVESAYSNKTEHTCIPGVVEADSMLSGVSKQLSQKTTILLTRAKEKICKTFGLFSSESSNNFEITPEMTSQVDTKMSVFSGIKKQISEKLTKTTDNKKIIKTFQREQDHAHHSKRPLSPDDIEPKSFSKTVTGKTNTMYKKEGKSRISSESNDKTFVTIHDRFVDKSTSNKTDANFVQIGGQISNKLYEQPHKIADTRTLKKFDELELGNKTMIAQITKIPVENGRGAINEKMHKSEAKNVQRKIASFKKGKGISNLVTKTMSKFQKTKIFTPNVQKNMSTTKEDITDGGLTAAQSVKQKLKLGKRTPDFISLNAEDPVASTSNQKDE